MKAVFTLFVSVLIFSCSTPESTTAELNQRIRILEHRMDSLLNAGKPASYSSAFYSAYSSDSGPCQAITQKGKACKRKGKYKGYCWQHKG